MSIQWEARFRYCDTSRFCPHSPSGLSSEILEPSCASECMHGQRHPGVDGQNASFFLRRDAPFSIKREEEELSACISNTRPCWHLIGYHTLGKSDPHNPTFRKLHLVARYQEDPTSVLERVVPPKGVCAYGYL